MPSQHHQSTNGHSKPLAHPGFHFVGINLNKFQLVVIYNISKKCRYAGINALLHVYNHTLTFSKLATRATLVLRVIVARMESQWRQ